MEPVMKPKVRPMRFLGLSLVLALAPLALGCGDRPDVWDAPAAGATSFGLQKAVVLVDQPADRLVSLGVAADGTLTTTRLPTGRGVVAAKVGPSGGRLYVLTAGHRGGLGDPRPDEKPRLTIVDGTTSPATSRDIELGLLTAPLDGLAIDPTERWAVLYAASGTGGAFVTNPNELVVVDLAATAGPSAARSKVLHSFGGHPEKLIFAPELLLPKGPTHLMIVQSAQDFALVTLDELARPEVTVRLADAAAVSRPRPAEIVVDDGEPARSDDARIGIRFDNGTSVMTLQLEPAAGENGFAPTINLSDVGGVPSAIAFVRTDGGLRLAALVPARSRAVLVEPATTITTEVTLPTGYQRLSLVTAAGATAGADVALLWNAGGAQAGVAFWELGKAAGLPFRSIETVGIDAKVDGVRDVPGKNAALKLLSTASAGAFYVLDLGDRTATPLLTASPNVTLSVSPTGERVWAYVPGGFDLAVTGLPDKHVTTLRVDSAVASVYEIEGAGGEPALVVLHGGGGVGATLFDGRQPEDAGRRIYGALLTEGPYDDR
jgi:hypothetical protein